FDVVDERGHVPEAVGLQLGRAVSRFGSLVFNGADEGRLFSADVTTGADKYLGAHIDAAAEKAFAREALLLAPDDFIADGGNAFFVFVADVDVALGGTED